MADKTTTERERCLQIISDLESRYTAPPGYVGQVYSAEVLALREAARRIKLPVTVQDINPGILTVGELGVAIQKMPESVRNTQLYRDGKPVVGYCLEKTAEETSGLEIVLNTSVVG